MGSISIEDNANNSFSISSYQEEIATFIVESSTPDTTGPEFNSVSITPNSVNSGETITLTVNATDDVSGLEYISIQLSSPMDEQETYVSGNIKDDWQDLGDNLYSKEIKISEWAVGGEWYISNISLSDNADNYTNAESSTTFTVNASTPDFNAPELNSFSITPNTINDGGTITLTLNITDDISGVDNINISLSSPNQEQYLSTYGTINEWKNLGNNSYSKEIEISEWAESGEWYVNYISIRDNANNSIYKSNYEGQIVTFTVNSSNEDIITPELNSTSITPNTVDNGGTITVTVNTTDNLSGIENIQFELSNSNNEQYYYIEEDIESWENLGNNDYAMDVYISEYAISGEWYIENLRTNDKAGNRFYKNDFSGVNTKFTVNNSLEADVTNPVLNSVSITPSIVNSGGIITVTINATDDLSGVKHTVFQIIDSSEGDDNIVINSEDTPWKSLGNDIYSIDITIDELAEEGEHYVSYIAVGDEVNNYYYTDLDEGDIASFTVDNSNLSITDQEILDFSIYPNPSDNGKFFISASNQDIEIVSISDYLGRKIDILDNKTIDLSNNSKGVYILKVKKGDIVSFHKLLSK